MIDRDRLLSEGVVEDNSRVELCIDHDFIFIIPIPSFYVF